MGSRIRRIVIIEGLWRYDNRLAIALERGLRKQFPGVIIVCESIYGCWPFEINRLIKFVECLAHKYDDGIRTMFLGHSFGGIIACALDGMLMNTPIAGIVTVCSPHEYMFGIFPYKIGADHKLEAPIITFGARYDVVVPWGSCHPQSREHQELLCDHRYWMICNEIHAERIARAAYAHFAYVA
jgi:pimeloyl-ACP methyl ester carboxylesterase